LKTVLERPPLVFTELHLKEALNDMKASTHSLSNDLRLLFKKLQGKDDEECIQDIGGKTRRKETTRKTKM
jgi:hypothetical protein